MTAPLLALPGERLTVPERIVVTPAVGLFTPEPLVPGDVINEGDVLGVVAGPGTKTAVRSPFAGTLMGMLAYPGERLREGQPVAWLRVA